MITPQKKLLDMYVLKGAIVLGGQTLSVGDAVITSPIGTGIFTVTAANPAVFSQTGHGLVAGNVVQFSVSGGALAAGLLPNTNYYVLAAGLGANSFEVSLTPGGTPVATTTTGSGTQFMSGPTCVIGAAGTTGKVLGTVLTIHNGGSTGNTYLQEGTATAPLDNAENEQINVDILVTDDVTAYIADLDNPVNTTPNSGGFGYFNLSSSVNGKLSESSFSEGTAKQFLSFGVNPGNQSQVIGIWSAVARI